MREDRASGPALPELPHIFNIGVTGHREGNASFDANSVAIEGALHALFAGTARELTEQEGDRPIQLRLITNLAHGSDLMAARIGHNHGMSVHAPLPFGRELNYAFNTPGLDWTEMLSVANGNAPKDARIREKYAELKDMTESSRCFELAEQDESLRDFLQRLAKDPSDHKARQDMDLMIAKRTKSASTVTVEQADVLLAIWDGTSPSALGGTRDTVAEALAAEVPVVWLDARAPSRWHWLDDPGDLAVAREREAPFAHAEVVDDICKAARENWSSQDEADLQMRSHGWQPRSRYRFHAYRRVEALFGKTAKPFRSIKQRYEPPSEIAEGSGKEILEDLSALPNSDSTMIKGIAHSLLPRFAKADGISTYLSDAYRGGMVANFLLSAAAIIVGVAYLPLVSPDLKWPFALVEFLILLTIVGITLAGVRGRWHQRWFRTRRIAEYLRHAPIMLAVGCTRPKGRWPTSRDAPWPELNARKVILAIGLPEIRATQEYLRQHLSEIVRPFLTSQRDYHRDKSDRLERVHHNLDHVSELLFVIAIISVGTYLLLKAASGLGLVSPDLPNSISKIATFLGVALPTLGAAIASIRYFGDFERFAAISDVTSQKLKRLIHRTDLLLEGEHDEVSYADFVDLVHEMNTVVIEEIESWQSIFGTKKMSVPV